MTRSPLMAAAVLVAGLLLAACGATSVGHGGAPKGSSSPSAKATPTPTAKPLSAAAAAEAGFRAWAEASVMLTGPMPAASRPAAAQDLLVLGRAYALPGWRTAVGKGLVLQETPAGCQASAQHVVAAFPRPQNAPQPVGVGAVVLVVHEFGACTTSAGGITYVQNPASGPKSSATWVLLGSMVPLPPVAGLPGLPKSVWTPVVVATCQSGWVVAAGGSGSFAATVPGC